MTATTAVSRRAALAAVALLFTLAALAAAVLVLALEREPRIDRPVALLPEHVARAKKMVDVHRYRVRPGMVASVRVLPEDADVAANYAAHRFAGGSAQVEMGERSARVRVSLPVPYAAWAGYVNVDAQLLEVAAGLPRPTALQVGRVAIPDWLVARLVPVVLERLRETPEFRLGIDALRAVRFSRTGLGVVYLWPGGFRDRQRTPFVSDDERARLLHYHTLLADRFHGTAPTPVALAELLPSLLRAAQARSNGGAGPAENRSAILVATVLALDQQLQLLLPEAANWPPLARRVVTLDGRDDFAKHFLVSAAIAAYADTALADAVGLYKELEDARSGSGFSFNDIAADRAGTRFGELAVGSEASARNLQQRVGAVLADSDLMPAWRDLPEGLPEAAFRQRYGSIDAPRFRHLMQEIEARVGALAVLR
jgi:hypothetical protein